MFQQNGTTNPQTKNLDFRGFDSGRFFFYRVDFPLTDRIPQNLDSGFLVLWILGMWTGRRTDAQSLSPLLPVETATLSLFLPCLCSGHLHPEGTMYWGG